MVSVWNAYHSQYFVLPHYQVANQTRKRDLKLMPGAISNTIKHFSRKKVCLRYWHRLNAPVSIVKEEPRLSPGTEVCVSLPDIDVGGSARASTTNTRGNAAHSDTRCQDRQGPKYLA